MIKIYLRHREHLLNDNRLSTRQIPIWLLLIRASVYKLFNIQNEFFPPQPKESWLVSTAKIILPEFAQPELARGLYFKVIVRDSVMWTIHKSKKLCIKKNVPSCYNRKIREELVD